MTDFLVRYIRFAGAFNAAVGRIAAWGTTLTVLVCFMVVLLRYSLSYGQIWMQDFYVWMHGAVFMCGAGYVYLAGGHVRGDIMYSRVSVKRKAAIDLFGVLVFLLPWLGVVVWSSWEFVSRSWGLWEPSAQADGLPGVFILKSVLLIFCAVLLIEGLAVVGRSILVLSGRGPAVPAVLE